MVKAAPAPRVGQVWEDGAATRIEILHVGSTHASVQRGTGVARIPLPDFDGSRWRLVEESGNRG